MYYPFAVKNLKKYNYKPKTSGTPGIGAIICPIFQENLITISVKIRIVTITLIFNTHLETAEKDLITSRFEENLSKINRIKIFFEWFILSQIRSAFDSDDFFSFFPTFPLIFSSIADNEFPGPHSKTFGRNSSRSYLSKFSIDCSHLTHWTIWKNPENEIFKFKNQIKWSTYKRERTKH